MQKKLALLFILLITSILSSQGQSHPGKTKQPLPAENGRKKAAEKLTHTVFTLQIDDPAFQADTSFKSLTIETITDRLRGVYNNEITPEDVVLDTGKILLHLHGEIDASLVKKLLNRKTEIRFLSGYHDVPGMLAQLKAKGAEKWLSFPPEEVTHFTYLGRMADKDTAEIKKIIGQIPVEKNLCWYFMKKGDDFSELYLLDEEHPIIKNEEVAHVAQQYDTTFKMATANVILNASGREKLAVYTKANIGEMLTIVVKGQLVLAAIISGEISWGNMTIANGATVEEMSKLVNKIGYPFPVNIRVTEVKVE